ncbi:MULTISPECIES: flagellar type III secretion system pore protein FliP [unclassified Caballeronia]|uniref:flagellar type III secretion system pore protein FliP n=1 Tax=unclassified Caballeronia TaxID=2646786 RepID=UPI00285DB54E|nr:MULTISPECIES: flagellar type III secretion system pore protein FliP [unclassified Caballeronia]MDR5774147.1 flagellar type III secretion system pore protein FliP [Caballeronia sp. LZ002]MDR5849582.1 flagellar type III secretion system pore protein FliP [Caballeronia sp. LZ003]
MNFYRLIHTLALCLIVCFLFASAPRAVAHARPAQAQPLTFSISDSVSKRYSAGDATSNTVRMAALLTVLSVGPALVISMTAFIRIIVVLSMIRHAFGMPETPPTPVLISLALFLTVFAMLPTLEAVNHDAFQPFMSGHIGLNDALARGAAPLRDFMLRQVRDDELKLTYELSGKALPQTPAEVSLLQLTPAFILNELRVAFQIGFVVLLPFLLIDLVVSSVLLSLGMMMVPPATISLPLKVLMFVLIDGWGLVLRGVLGSFR